jgi:microsomal dipeptidase-like Zn-dependent dipeptidase
MARKKKARKAKGKRKPARKAKKRVKKTAKKTAKKAKRKVARSKRKTTLSVKSGKAQATVNLQGAKPTGATVSYGETSQPEAKS